MAFTFSGVTITGGWSITGGDAPSVTPTVEYLVVAGGGGGGGSVTAGAGGAGGGGGAGFPGTGTAGTVNTGGGGGGGGNGNNNGGGGGSGIVIIRYSDSYPLATSTTGSPTITNPTGYRVYTWTSSGSITF